jgi:RNA polymerase sigma factor (sigma-70 family)
MSDEDFLTARFEEQRPRLQGVAYRMLGSRTEAEDAVQDVWMRLDRSDADAIENFGGWLTTVTARVCLNRLRSRGTHPEDPVGVHVPDPVITSESSDDPEQAAVLADAVGLALHVVIETLPPAERLAFVLHDLFAVPFDEIAPILDRSPEATRQLASRGRRRVQGAPVPDSDRSRHREVVDAFFAAARGGDMDALLAVLDPDVVVRSDGGASRPEVTALARGAGNVASRAMMFSQTAAGDEVRPVLVNGAVGILVLETGRPVTVMGFTVRGGRIVEIDVLADTERVAALDLSAIA